MRAGEKREGNIITSKIGEKLAGYGKQAGAELGQEQLKLRLDFNSINLIKLFLSLAAASG